MGIATYQLIGGIVGALGALLLLFVIPYCISLVRGEAELVLTPPRVVGAVGLLAATLILGVLSAALLSSTDFKTSLVAGLAYQSTVGGAVKGYVH